MTIKLRVIETRIRTLEVEKLPTKEELDDLKDRAIEEEGFFLAVGCKGSVIVDVIEPA